MSLRGWLPGGQWGAWRWRDLLKTWRTARVWREKRLSYINENLELRAILRTMGVRAEAVEELLRDKQEKIVRLQTAIALFNQTHHPGVRGIREHDMRPERILSSSDEWLEKFSRDFDARQQAYENTGNYDRRDRVSTKPGPEDTGADPD